MPKIQENSSFPGEHREAFEGCVPPVVDANRSGNENRDAQLIGEFREHSGRAKTLRPVRNRKTRKLPAPMANSIEDTSRFRVNATNPRPIPVIDRAIQRSRNTAQQRRRQYAGITPGFVQPLQARSVPAARRPMWRGTWLSIRKSRPWTYQNWKFRNSVAITKAGSRQSSGIAGQTGSESNHGGGALMSLDTGRKARVPQPRRAHSPSRPHFENFRRLFSENNPATA